MKYLASLCVLVLVTVALFAADASAATATLQSTHALGWTLLGLGVLGTALVATNPTLIDLRNALDSNDRVAPVIEILNQQNEILDDMTVIPGNELTGHIAAVRTGIPAPTWRKLYGGVQPTKSTRVKVRDSFGNLENYLKVDKALADLNNNSAAFMASEARAILEGFNQEMATSLFYASEDVTPEKFTGIAPRFNSLSAQNGANIIDCLGTTNLTSIYLVVWGPSTVHGIYPAGLPAGFSMGPTKDVTDQNIDGVGGHAEVYLTHFQWSLGLTVLDWRYIVRAANIDYTALTKAASAGADIIDIMTQMLEKVQDTSSGRPVFYMSRTLRSFLRRQMVNKVASSTLQMGDVSGKRVITYDDIPVRRTDAILNTETRIV